MPSPMTHHTTCTHNAVTRQPVTECVLIWRHHLTQTYDITLFYSTMCLRGLISPIIHRVYIFGTFGRYFGSIINALTSRRNDFAYAIVWRTPEIGRNLSRSQLSSDSDVDGMQICTFLRFRTVTITHWDDTRREGVQLLRLYAWWIQIW